MSVRSAPPATSAVERMRRRAADRRATEALRIARAGLCLAILALLAVVAFA